MMRRRARSHLHNLIHRSSQTLHVLVQRQGEVVGGTTFRLFAYPGLDFEYCAEVVLIAVSQTPGAAGQGHGTRLVNYTRALLGALPPPRPAHSISSANAGCPWYTQEESMGRSARRQSGGRCMVTQADDGMQAVNFWGRQGFHTGEAPRPEPRHQR